MENGRNHDDGISGRQLRELLRSLPAAHAPEDLELNLMYRIAENKAYPHRSRARYPRARVRLAPSEGTAPRTRGYDRMRGLAAAALAAFIVAGGWTFYSDRTMEVPVNAPAQTRTIDASAAAEAASSSPAVSQPKSNVRGGTLLNPSQTIVIEKVGDGDLKVVPSPDQVRMAEEKRSNDPLPTTAVEQPKPRATARPETSSSHVTTAPAVTPASTHASSGASTTSADTVSQRSAVSAPAGGLDVGTGGEPPEEKESE